MGSFTKPRVFYTLVIIVTILIIIFTLCNSFFGIEFKRKFNIEELRKSSDTLKSENN